MGEEPNHTTALKPVSIPVWGERGKKVFINVEEYTYKLYSLFDG